VLGFYPPLARASGFRSPQVPIVLVLVGAAMSGLAYRYERCRRAGPLFTLVDNGFYSAAVAAAAVSMRGGYAVALAVLHVAAALAMPATTYSLTPLLLLVIWLPPVALVAWMAPPPEVAIILLGGVLPFILVSHQTGRRRRFEREQRLKEEHDRQERARREEPLQLALTRVLLDVGHLLHELRNKQTAVDASLQHLARLTSSEGPAQAAMQVALAAEQDELRFVERMLGRVKNEAECEPRAFSLRELLESVASADRDWVRVEVSSSDYECAALGDPERLRWVLMNLIRNAAQASARRVVLEMRVQRNRAWVELDVADDGCGMDPVVWARRFEPFAASSRPGSTGLGLYLSRRYVELMGGRIEGVSSGKDGTVVRIVLRVADAVDAGPVSSRRRKVA
jgi:signal transduction histidine kinase